MIAAALCTENSKNRKNITLLDKYIGWAFARRYVSHKEII